jgi:hypothetical protein
MLLDWTAELKTAWRWWRIVGRFAAPARFGRPIRAGGAPIYRGNLSTRSRRGDELNSISNLKQTRRIATDFGKGKNSGSGALCLYELGIGFGFRSGKEGAPGGLSWVAREAGPGCERERVESRLGCSASAGAGQQDGPRGSGKGKRLPGRTRFPAGFRPSTG